MPTLERFYSAKSEVARSQEDLSAHGEVMDLQAANASQALHMPCFGSAHAKHDISKWAGFMDDWLMSEGAVACVPQVELSKQDELVGSPAGAHVADDGAPARWAAQGPPQRGLERETSLPPTAASGEVDATDHTYERVSTCCFCTDSVKVTKQ